MPWHLITRPGFDSYAVHELLMTLGEPRRELGALLREKKVSLG